MTGKIRYIGFAFLATLLALTSCRNLELEPVFYALSQEVPLGDDKGFPDVASVFRMVKFNDGAYDYYLAAAGRLYIRGALLLPSPAPSDRWATVAPPAGLANAMCNTLELFGTTIYAGFYDSSNGAGYGLYTAPLTLPITWNLAADADVQNVQISLIRSAGTQLFVATHTGASVNTLYFDNGANFDPVTGIPDTSSVIDVESFGGSYWILAGSSLYSAGAPAGPFNVYAAGMGSPPDSPLLSLSVPPHVSGVSGGLFNDGTALYVSAGNGHLYRTDGGDIWTISAEFLDDDEFTTRFTAFAAPGADAVPAGTVYVGTQAQGYRRIPGGDVTGGTGTLTREPAYNIAALYSGSLNFLFYDAGATPPLTARLFLGTNGSGLWRGDYASGSTWTWKQE